MHLSHTLLLLPLTLAAHLRVSIPASNSLPNPAVLPPSTSATLTTLSKIHTAPLRADNSFDFRNVTAGSYLLDVHCHTHAFAPLRVDVHDAKEELVNVWGTFRGNEWGNKGEALQVTKAQEGGDKAIWGFDVKVLGGKEYLVVREGFSPMSILKNPMILLAGFSMILVFGMPYLMDSMDPEMRAEFEQHQKKSPVAAAPANPLQNFDAAAWLAGKSTSGSSTPKASEPVERGITR